MNQSASFRQTAFSLMNGLSAFPKAFIMRYTSYCTVCIVRPVQIIGGSFITQKHLTNDETGLNHSLSCFICYIELFWSLFVGP